jgi:hypothetical protein
MINSLQINRYILNNLLNYVKFIGEEGFPDKTFINIQNGTLSISTSPVISYSNTKQITSSSLVYKLLDSANLPDVSEPIKEWRTSGLFSCNNSERINTFISGTVSSDHQKYFMSIYNKPTTHPNSYHEFDLAYAHISGSGSSYEVTVLTEPSELLPAKTMFRKYILDCFDTVEGKFPFKNNKNGDYFYAIHFNRNSFKDRLDIGNFQLTLAPISSSTNQLINTGSNFYPNPSSSVIYTLIDDSIDGKEYVTYTEELKDYYYLVSGSLNDGIYGESENDAWGIVFPRKGLIILDGVVLDQSCSFNTVTASIDGDNIKKLFYSISGSTTPNVVRTETGSWWGRGSQEYMSETYFCRALPSEMNFSNNPTYVSGSNKELKYLTMREEPQVYISSIGLYNGKNELLAVGKLEKPLLKKHNTECNFHVRIRLN